MMLRKSKVTTRREGKQIFYSISDPKLQVVLKTLYETTVQIYKPFCLNKQLLLNRF